MRGYKFRITRSRIVREYTTVAIEARDLEEAYQIAENLASADRSEWCVDNSHEKTKIERIDISQ